jgi:hypothetical protein
MSTKANNKYFVIINLADYEDPTNDLQKARENLIRKLNARKDPRTKKLAQTATKLAVPAVVEKAILASNEITINWNYISSY